MSFLRASLPSSDVPQSANQNCTQQAARAQNRKCINRSRLHITLAPLCCVVLPPESIPSCHNAGMLQRYLGTRSRINLRQSIRDPIFLLLLAKSIRIMSRIRADPRLAYVGGRCLARKSCLAQAPVENSCDMMMRWSFECVCSNGV